MTETGRQLSLPIAPAGEAERVAARRGELREAARLLGWSGEVLPDTMLLGDRVTVVAIVDHEVHARRLARGWGPVVDRTAVAMWSWPENRSSAPERAVRVEGILADGDRWQRTVDKAADFGGFGSTAVVTGSAEPPSELCLLTAQLHGVGVVWRAPDGSLSLASPGRVGPVPTARPTVVSRWVEELVYERYLAVAAS